MPALDLHPLRDDLEAFALGRLDDPSYTGVEEHVDACSSCQEFIDHVPGDAFVELLRSAESVSDTAKALDGATLANTGTDTPVAGSITSPWATAEATGIEIPAALLGHPRYEPTRLLGSGGMGTVWLAQHRVMGRQVAVKLIRSDLVAKPGAAERFRREAQAAARLAHPNIVAAFDAEAAGDANMLAMEYVDGVNLADELRRRGRLPVAEACEIVRQAALGLQHAFECGLIHRDLKPHNLMRTADGTVKILDFGLAVLADSGARGDLTGENVVLGTPDYIAPEQAEDSHAADIRSDIYALGCTLYHLLTGRVPFPGESVLRKLDGHRGQEPEALRSLHPEVPAELAAIVARMMAKKPAARWQTPAEVAEALAPFASGMPPVRKRPRTWIAVAAAALFAVIVAGAGVVYRIQTYNGDVVITPGSPDVEIVLLKGNKEIEVIDTKTNKRVTVPTGIYDVALKNKLDGIEVTTDRIVVSRGKDVLVTIVRLPKAGSADKVGEVRRFDGHAGSVRGVAYAPNGRYALSLGGWPNPDRTMRLWDLAAGKEVWRKLADGVDPVSVAFHPDGIHAVTGSQSGDLRLWEVATGKEIRAWAHGQQVYAVAFTPDGKFLLSGGFSGWLRVWDVNTGKQVREFQDRTGWITSIAVSPDGGRAVTGGDDLVRVSDLRTGKELQRFNFEGQGYVAFGPGGRSVLSGGLDKMIHLWDPETGKEIRRFIGHKSGISSLVLSSDGSRILSGGDDGTIRLWDPATAKELYCFGEGQDPTLGAYVRAVLSPDGNYAFSGDATGKCYLWRLPDPKPAEKFGEVRRFEGHTGSVRGVAYAPNGRHALSISGWPNPDRTMRLWDLSTGKEVWRRRADPEDPVCVAFHPDGIHAVTGGKSGELRLWEVATGKEIRAWTHGQQVYAVAFTPDGKLLVSGGSSGWLRVWDVNTGKQVNEFEDRKGWITSIAVSPDGGRAVTGGSDDDLVRVSDLQTGREVLRVKTNGGSVAFGPGGRSLLSGWRDKMIHLWDAESGKEIRRFIGHKAEISSIALSSDGSRILAGGDDGTIRLWDLGTGKELHCFGDRQDPTLGDYVRAVFSPDGRYAFSGDATGKCCLWRLPDPR